MKQGSNNRRSRSRGGGGKRQGNVRSQNFESNGPGVKVRGSAQQVLDKYLGLARDASSSGDRILAESFFQYAEHYYRLLNSDEQRGDARGGNGRGRQQHRQTPADDQKDQKQDAPAAEKQGNEAPEKAAAQSSGGEAEVIVANAAGKAEGESDADETKTEAPDAA